MALELTKQRLKPLFKTLGYNNIDNWTDDDWDAKLARMVEANGDNPRIDDEELGDLYDKILQAHRKKTKVVVVVPDGDGKAPEVKAAKAPGKKVAKKAGKTDEAILKDFIGDDVKPLPKPGKKAPRVAVGDNVKPPKKKVTAKAAAKAAANGKPARPEMPRKARGKPGPKGVGITDTIVEMLRKASPKNPVTVAEVTAELTKRFPSRVSDRPGGGLGHTAMIAMGSENWGLRKKGYKIGETDTRPAGFWLISEPKR